MADKLSRTIEAILQAHHVSLELAKVNVSAKKGHGGEAGCGFHVDLQLAPQVEEELIAILCEEISSLDEVNTIEHAVTSLTRSGSGKGVTFEAVSESSSEGGHVIEDQGVGEGVEGRTRALSTSDGVKHPTLPITPEEKENILVESKGLLKDAELTFVTICMRERTVHLGGQILANQAVSLNYVTERIHAFDGVAAVTNAVRTVKTLQRRVSYAPPTEEEVELKQERQAARNDKSCTLL